MIARVFPAPCPIVVQASSLPVVVRASSLPAPKATPLPSGCPAPGFTLIEILASLAILAIGLTSVLSMVLGSGRLSSEAARRNVAAIIITEAVADIERRHLITNNLYNSADKVGLLVETVNLTGNPYPNTHDGHSYQNLAPIGGPPLSTWNANTTAPYLGNAVVNTLVWPLSPDPKYIGGPVVTQTGQQSSAAYRAVYRLERHPDWMPPTLDPVTGAVLSRSEDPTSPYVGCYVLTLAVYADPTTNCSRLEQIGDPVVVYLRDKKPR